MRKSLLEPVISTGTIGQFIFDGKVPDLNLTPQAAPRYAAVATAPAPTPTMSTPMGISGTMLNDEAQAGMIGHFLFDDDVPNLNLTPQTTARHAAAALTPVMSNPMNMSETMVNDGKTVVAGIHFGDAAVDNGLAESDAPEDMMASAGERIMEPSSTKVNMDGTVVPAGDILTIDGYITGTITIQGQLEVAGYSMHDGDLHLDVRAREGSSVDALNPPMIIGFENFIDYQGNRKSFTVDFRYNPSNGYYRLTDSIEGEYVVLISIDNFEGTTISAGSFEHFGGRLSPLLGIYDKRIDFIENSDGVSLLVRDRWIVYDYDTQFSVADSRTYDAYQSGYRGIFTTEEGTPYSYNGNAYGGSLIADTARTVHMELRASCGIGSQSSKHHIFGGGKGYSTGGVEWLIHENANVYSYIVGGGHNADVTGDVNFDIRGGSFSVLVGGGLANDVNGRAEVTNVNMNITEFSRVNANQNNFIVGGGYALAEGAVTAVDTVNIVIGGCSRIDYVYGGGRASNGGTSTVETVNLTIDGGNYHGYVNGGGRSDSGGKTVTGDINLTINGGTFNNYVIGGSYANNGEAIVDGDINVTITGGTFLKTVYGATHSSSAGLCGDMNGDIYVTVDARGDNRIDFGSGSGIIAGGTGGTNCCGHTTLTLTGNGDNITTAGGKFTGYLYGDGGVKDPGKTHTIHFANFTDDDFNASIRGFNNVHCSGDTVVVINSISTWGGNYSFDLTGRNSSLFDTAMFTKAAGVMNIDEETLFKVQLTSDDIEGLAEGEIMLMTVQDSDLSCFFGLQAVELTYVDNGVTYTGVETFNGSSLTLGGVEFSFLHDSLSGKFAMNFLT